MQSPSLELDPARLAIAEQHTARIVCSLVAGRPVDAVAAVERCRAELDHVQMPITQSTALHELFTDRHVSSRAINLVEEHLGARRLGDLVHVRPNRIAQVPGIGGVELAKILQAIIQRLPVETMGGD